MKKVILILIFLLIAGHFSLFAQDDGFGAGLILGEPTGLSLKLWLDPHSAIDMGFAWSFYLVQTLSAHADYLYHFLDLIPPPIEWLDLYVGIGAKTYISITAGDAVIGLRIPVGVVVFIEDFPLDIFLEFVPGMNVYPRTEPAFGAGIGIRYFFSKAKEESGGL